MFKIFFSIFLFLSFSSVQADAVKILTNANIRLAASINSDVVAWATKGENLDRIQTADGWTKVRRANGKTGWISNTLIQEYPVAKPCRTADVAAQIGGGAGAFVGVGVAGLTTCCATTGPGCVICAAAGGLAGLIIGSKGAEAVAELTCD